MRTPAILAALAFLSPGGLPAEEPKPTGRLYANLADKNDWVPHPAPAPPATVPAEPPLPPAPDGHVWRQTFADEFNGTALDPKKWRIYDNYPRKGGYWLKDHVTLDGKGHLLIRVDRVQDPETKEWRKIAGGIDSRHKQRFGYFVCRYRMLRQNGHGYHCAFWLQSPGSNTVTGDGRNGTEIDIIEKFRFDDVIQHCLHWDGYGEHHKRTKFSFDWPGIREGFHTFAVAWSSDEYVFYVDGVETWRTTAGGVSQVPAVARFTVEFSEGWNGRIEDAELPDHFIVDWVRVYEAAEERP